MGDTANDALHLAKRVENKPSQCDLTAHEIASTLKLLKFPVCFGFTKKGQLHEYGIQPMQMDSKRVRLEAVGDTTKEMFHAALTSLLYSCTGRVYYEVSLPCGRFTDSNSVPTGYVKAIIRKYLRLPLR